MFSIFLLHNEAVVEQTQVNNLRSRPPGLSFPTLEKLLATGQQQSKGYKAVLWRCHYL